MADTKDQSSGLPILARGEAQRRVRRVLLALATVAVVFLATIGIGLRFLADEIQNSVAMAGVIRNANFIANVLANADLGYMTIEGLSESQPQNLGTDEFAVL